MEAVIILKTSQTLHSIIRLFLSSLSLPIMLCVKGLKTDISLKIIHMFFLDCYLLLFIKIKTMCKLFKKNDKELLNITWTQFRLI